MAPWQQQLLEQSAVNTLTHFLQSQCNELKFTLQLNNWATNLFIPDPYSTDNLVYAAKKKANRFSETMKSPSAAILGVQPWLWSLLQPPVPFQSNQQLSQLPSTLAVATN